MSFAVLPGGPEEEDSDKRRLWEKIALLIDPPGPLTPKAVF